MVYCLTTLTQSACHYADQQKTSPQGDQNIKDKTFFYNNRPEKLHSCSIVYLMSLSQLLLNFLSKLHYQGTLVA